MRPCRSFAALTLALLLTAGCDNPPPDTDAGPAADAGPGDAGPTGDGNDSFETATPIANMPAMGVIDAPGDLDYYSFEGEAGQWWILETTANPDTTPGRADTVLTLFDSSMTQIAENDDSQPRFNPDSQIITRLPSAGTYYVLVQEFSTWMNETPRGGANFDYELVSAPLNIAGDVVAEDAETGDDVASATPVEVSNGENADFGIVVGSLRDAADVDVFSFEITTRSNFEATLMPPGVDGYGSTATPSRVWITNADGSDTIASVDLTAAAANDLAPEIQPSLPAGDYRLFVEHGGTAGANDHYVFKIFGLNENPLEDVATEATNNVAATPDDLTMMDEEGRRRALILARLGDGDVDHFRFEIETGEALTVVCRSRLGGSGVVDLNAAILNPDGTEVSGASATETATEALVIDAVTVDPGMYLLRLMKGSQSATVSGDWVRCGVIGAPPAP